MTDKTYRIFHNYDRGDQSVYLASSNDPTGQRSLPKAGERDSDSQGSSGVRSDEAGG